ncbi:MAG: AmmeMemoRadiSam system radical SAM enzyme [Methanocorpusculum sp.]|nr:AmmeMemoRadiSam system radical SAM enzyme [Methanocorpusculum sp.]
MDAKFFDSKSEKCGLCARRCHIPRDSLGFCKVRKNENGVLKALSYGCVTAAALDPVEKKPLYHFLPASNTFSISGYSCNFSCKHCQNYSLSQNCEAEYYEFQPEDVVASAKNSGAESISFTYNEPTISYEFVYDVCAAAHKSGLKTALITNGYMTEEALTEIAMYLDAIRIDLKAFTDKFYKEVCSAKLQPVLDTIISANEKQIHTELVTLLIPSLNDSADEINSMLEWETENLGKAVPHHFTAFTPMYKMTDVARTSFETVDRAFRLAKSAGLYYPYVGNIMHSEGSKTYCPNCGELLILRAGYVCKTPGLLKGGVCKKCGRKIEGIY